MELGKLKEIKDLRSVWPHEALNFTPWLAENIELLGEAIGIENIIVQETESAVGDFHADIVAIDSDNERTIVIENQLEDTDHDHLGKIITYASGKDADIIVWIVGHAREEHRAAIEWLNNHTDDDIGFFLCEIKLVQIGDSAIAPHFVTIESPNNWVKEIKKVSSGTKTKLPKINDMLDWGIVSEGDVIKCKGHKEESILMSNGHVAVGDEEMSMQKWLQQVTGWPSVQTYALAIQKKTGRTLSDLRKEYMEKEM